MCSFSSKPVTTSLLLYGIPFHVKDAYLNPHIHFSTGRLNRIYVGTYRTLKSYYDPDYSTVPSLGRQPDNPAMTHSSANATEIAY